MAASSISTGEEQPPRHQVFISFRGADLRRRFVSHLVTALELNNINVFIDDYEDRGQPLEILLQRIEESKIALAIFSGKYTDSIWCVRELEKIKACVDEGTLIAIPIFYKVEPSTVRGLKGSFGDKFRSLAKGDQRKKKWKEAFNTIPDIMGITVEKKSVESEKVNETVKAVKRVLNRISSEGSRSTSLNPSENVNGGTSSVGQKHKTFGNEQRLKELGEKLDRTKYKGTRVIGVVGMPGIGKTTLLKELYETWRCRFSRHVLLDQIHEKFKHVEELDCLPEMLVTALLKSNNGHIDDDKDPYSQLQERKVLVLLDDVTKKEQIDVLREILGRIKEGNEGSRVVIATSDMSLLNDMVDDTYMVQNLNHSDSSQLFHYHTFGDQAYPPREDVFAKLSEKFVHYARGHPLALKILGAGLNPNNIEHWKSKLDILAQLQIPTEIRSVFKVSYDELCSEHKNAFLDIACFRSEEVDYVESLLASSDPRSAEAMSPVKALTDKFLINTCDGRVEMHDLLYTFSRELDSEECPQYGSRKRRLWLHKHIIKGRAPDLLQTTTGTANVRGVFLDLSEVKGEMSLDKYYFRNMVNLRYLKFYNSHCPQECNTYNKINIPDGLKLPLKEVRCLHWLKFPLEELPNDFNPINLVDLKLTYSEIQKLWEGDKDTPVLKWVDLSHSSNLCNLSELSKALNLQRLNLEGCTALEMLPNDMNNMKRLAFLNLKGCTSLESLPEMNLVPLKTLTLSGCSSFKEFPLVSENIEILYLDGTAIGQLPENMEKLQRLVVLNMKSCKMLQKIPNRVGELKALQELILSDCSNLNFFPEIKMNSLNILLLDGTAIEVMPQIPSLQYLCLSRNKKITCLPAGICKLYQLKWLDLKYCTSLTSVPEFPPNLQCLDAQGCSSLKTISKPLARIMPTEQNPSTFIFTNCKNLKQAAKEEITSYAQRKCQLLSYARKRYNGDLVSEALFSTCFPGCEVPSWFCHETVGSEIELKLLPHWHDKRLAGIALCAVVSFSDCETQISRLSVTCTFKVKVEDKPWVPFTCPVGSWSRQGDGQNKIDSDHVFIGYTSCPYTIKCPEDENSDKCSSTEACLEFTVTGGTNEKGKLKVLKCGLGLVYAKDKRKNSSHGAKYDMPVEVSVQETSGMVNEDDDDERPKKKQRSTRDDNIPCQIGIHASVPPRSNDNSVARPMVENPQARDESVPSEAHSHTELQVLMKKVQHE